MVRPLIAVSKKQFCRGREFSLKQDGIFVQLF
jgi:hypothetical protein